MFSEPSLIASELRSLNDLPDKILLKILSYFEPEDLCLIIPKVCKRWNALAKDVALWKKLMYSCDGTGGIFCYKMADRGLLEGIGSLHELTSLHLTTGSNLTAQALSKFLHQPSVAPILLLNLSECLTLDDKGLKGIAKRWDKLTYLHG